MAQSPLVLKDGIPQPDEPAWNDLSFPLTQGRQGASSKPEYDYTNLGYLFPQNDTADILYLTFQMPHWWKTGTEIRPHVHWHQSVDLNVTWKIDYRWTNVGDAVSGTWTTLVMDQLAIDYSLGTIHQISKSASGIDATGKGISSELQIKLYRDDNVYTGNALATMFDIHVLCDALGSEQEYVK